jgi:uncharacterized membrane protein
MSPDLISAVVAAFLATIVEVIEAFTIVLAVASLNGVKPALIGAAAALVVLTVATLALGPALMLVPIGTLQLVIGVLLLLFGFGWLRKAILRAAGILPLHDQAQRFERKRASLEVAERGSRGGSRAAIGALAAFKAVLLEGVEVVFIVVAMGASVQGGMLPAALGAAAGTLLVFAVGLVLYRPLANLPENSLKFAVGLVTATFGLFWTGEGLGLSWPGEDLALLFLFPWMAVVAFGLVVLLRRQRLVAA